MTTAAQPKALRKRFQAGSREAWAFVVVSIVALIAVASFATGGPPTPDQRSQELADQYACPQCKGQSVAESNAAVAETIRDFISIQVRAGASDQEIRSALVASYGTGVLLTPPSDGAASLIWILPVLVLVGGSAIVYSSVASARGGSAEPTSEDEAIVRRLRESPGE